jgi:limonene-1,2-epoxide hydrolase
VATVADAGALVREFLGNMEASYDAMTESVRTRCAPDCTWSNTGLPTAEGRDAMLAFLEGMRAAAGIEALRVDMVGLAVAGDTVLTERVDHLLDAQGKTTHSVAVMGTFEVRDGLIAAWRDYFDPSPFLAAASG